MNDFTLWLVTGIEHIADLNAYDHILFVSLLVLAYPLNEWKKLVWLITAFTVGHSFALALSTMNILNVNSKLIEICIALSILLTVLLEFYFLIRNKFVNTPLVYSIVVFFGMVHGLGFSFLLKSMLGKEENVFLPLVYFNLGIEIGQLIIVAIVLVFSLLITKILKWPYKLFKIVILSIIALTSLYMFLERLLLLF